MSYVGFQYAEALFALANEENVLEEVAQAYQDFLSANDEEIILFMSHPKVHKKDKKAILEKAITTTLFRHFLNVLIDNSRIDLVSDIHDEFTKIIDHQNKVMNAVVYSNRALDEKEMKKLQENLSKKHNRKVLLENRVDTTILGGLRIEYEGYVLDDTINNYLTSLKANLTK